MIEVPAERLPAETLERLLAEVALRDDTDYGDRPRSLDERIALVKHALGKGELVIVFDPGTESVSIVPRDELARQSRR